MSINILENGAKKKLAGNYLTDTQFDETSKNPVQNKTITKSIGTANISSMGDGTITGAIDALNNTKQDKSTAVTHAGSTAVGTTNQPVYIDANGSAIATTYTLNTDVPFNAKFTDTVTTAVTTGDGNAVTEISATNGALTITKGTTFQTTDTKNTAGATDTSDRIFLIGSKFQTDNPQTYSQDTAYVGTDGCLYSGGTKVLTSHQDISGKQDKLTAGSNITINGTTISATDTTYSSKSAASGGTEVSLVTTGEKYAWNQKGSGNGDVAGPSSSTNGHIATFNGTTGKTIKDSGYTIATSVPSGAKFTDTVTTASTTGSGNAVTAISASNGALTVTKGTTFSTTDTKNTAGSTDSSSKLFLIGATSQAANPQTYSQDTAYVGTDGCLYSGSTKVLTAHQDISSKQDKTDSSLSTTSKTVVGAINEIQSALGAQVTYSLDGTTLTITTK